MKQRIATQHVLQLIAFLVGAVVMSLEMIGSRILAPYFGASLNTWTVLIGIILGSLSVGYWYGGIRADKGVRKRDLAQLLLVAGIFIAAVGLFHNVIINCVLALPHITLLWGCVMSSAIFFIIPNMLLGMVNPYLAKLMITSLDNSGVRVGNLGAISTVGNIVGTCGASFFLIPLFGVTIILICLGIILIIISLFLDISHKAIGLFFITALFVVVAGYPRYIRYLEKNGLTGFDTQYGKILIYKDDKSSYLITGAFGYESKKSSSPYLPHFGEVIADSVANPKRALIIGGGVFNLSNFLLETYPSLHVDTVEIDRKVVESAYSHFGYKENSRHTIVIEDGRTFINTAEKETYDLVVNDAYHDIVPPHHLITQEAVKGIYDSLRPDGVYVANIASALTGEKAWLLDSSYRTVLSVFPQVVIIPLEERINGTIIQSSLLLAFKKNKDIPLLRVGGLPIYKEKDKSFLGGSVLTDDFAPVEFNLISTTAGQSRFHFSRHYLSLLMKATYRYLFGVGPST